MECRGLTKSFRNRLALKGVNLEIAAGEWLVVFGPNGAGKTTLINLLATIMRPNSGSIRIDGLDVQQHAEEVRRKIGLVSHQTFLYGNLTAYENLLFYSRMYDVPDPARRIREVAGMMAVTSRLDDRVGTLSRGLQQRVAIARCLLHRPSLILLDEPETGLDIQASALLWKALQAEEKRTVVHTTHNLERGFEQCDRLMMLARGSIVYQGNKPTVNLAELKQTYQKYLEVGA